jgi:hypothetical protein
MKKILFGSVSAILAVVDLSSFKEAKKFAITKYYFQVNSGTDIALGTTVSPSQVFWISTGQVKPADPCDDLSQVICVIGVTLPQVTTINKTHLKNSVRNVTIYTRGAGE